MNLQERYHQLLDEVAETTIACNRTPGEVTLVAVSKTQPLDAIQQVYLAGCREFGENRVQEALPKIESFGLPAHWHFIGTLQKKKVNKVIGKFHLIHSIDSLDLAQKISENSLEKGLKTPILLEVNTSGELSKHGFTSDMLVGNMDSLASLQGIELQGLMTMAPLNATEKVIRSCFSALRELRDKLQSKVNGSHSFHHLSMGMSHDYKIAIQEGATIIRIGTALFGSSF